MMKKKSIAMLAELAQERRDAAGQRLAQALTLLKDSEARLALLERYRGEYGERYARSAEGGIAPGELRNFRGFLERLDQALAQQRAEVEALSRGALECRAHLLQEHTRGKSFDVLAGRAEDAARAGEARRLQKLLDEFSGRLAAAAP
jgi:flagellar FliJ protein